MKPLVRATYTAYPGRRPRCSSISGFPVPRASRYVINSGDNTVAHPHGD
jgi:hypothetical protein